MYCTRCGAQNDDNAYKCLKCGEILHDEFTNYYPPQNSGKAIASLVCSIAGIVVCLFLGQIIGIVLGYQAKREIQESEGRLTGEGMASAGIIVGWIGIVLDIIIVLVWASFFALTVHSR